MSEDIHRERAFVSDLYPSPRWKKKVARMRDEQVIAIYLRERARLFDKPPKQDKPDQDDIPF